jgi:exopolyphosphatase/guanosine-5'-triphosphate,3'-diphosphate pyrophosphatase
VRIGVVDIGTNSTRLLIAEIEGERVTAELARESRVTRLGQGVDATGALADEAMERVFAVLADYRGLIDAHGVTDTVAVLTSAVRDASNGAAFTEAVRERFGLEARVIPGDEEARLTFLGATSERAPDPDAGELLVVDIGGGSTELVAGRGRDVSFFVSLQAGVVRQTERHLHHDPPRPEELEALRTEVATIIDEYVPQAVRDRVTGAVAVAGTATSTAAIDLALEPYDPAKVHGHVLTPEVLDRILAHLASIPDAERRKVPGLHPDRAPTIVAGVAMLREVARAFGLAHIEVSEHDILRGAALHRAVVDSGPPQPA